MRAPFAFVWLACACTFPTTSTPQLDAAASDGPVDAPVDGPPQNFHLRIEALVDGESHLHIKGRELKWKHYLLAAPGRWDADGVAPFDMRPTKLDGVDWFPAWPDVPNPENRICTAYPCAGVDSSTTQLAVGIPRVPSTVTWVEVQSRRPQAIVQEPEEANDWELIMLVTDMMVGGSADYIIDIDVTIQ
jgi:hypothetical protein